MENDIPNSNCSFNNVNCLRGKSAILPVIIQPWGVSHNLDSFMEKCWAIRDGDVAIFERHDHSWGNL